jgi:hypothetical protein
MRQAAGENLVELADGLHLFFSEKPGFARIPGLGHGRHLAVVHPASRGPHHGIDFFLIENFFHGYLAEIKSLRFKFQALTLGFRVSYNRETRNFL